MENNIMGAQEVITRAGNYFVQLRNKYSLDNITETNVYRYIENQKAIELLNDCIDLFTNFQKEFDLRNKEVKNETCD